MNKIIIENNIIKEQSINNNIKVNYSKSDDLSSVYVLKINCIESTDLHIYYNIKQNIKINVIVNCFKNVDINIFEWYTDGILKIKNIYNISTSSRLNIQKFYDVEKIKQNDVINLNGEHSSLKYILKTISSNEESYNLVINHKASYTNSDIVNNSINVKNGAVIFDVTGIVPNGIIECNLKQNNRVVTFNKKLCQINPNLLIDEDNVIAEHSAFIGKFNDEDLFYLQSRGISYDEAIKLLIKGFLFSGLQLDESSKINLENIIKKYWR